jgi:hypothetical protein
MRRSEGSLKSLTAFRSECCTTPSSASSRLGLELITRSSSSPLYLRVRSEPSLCSQMSSLAAEEPEALCKILVASPCTAFFVLSLLSLTDSDIIQYLLLVAMTLQIPHYIDEIIEILQSHIHAFPLLIVLGVFPSLYLKKRLHNNDSSSNLVSRSTSSIASSSKTLAGIEEYYRNCAESTSAFVTSSLAKVTSPKTSTDDWGHFTDIDESTQY